MSLLNLFRNNELAIRLFAFFSWLDSIHFMLDLLNLFCLCPEFLGQLLILRECLRQRALTKNLAIVSNGNDELGDGARHCNVVGDQEDSATADKITLEALLHNPFGGVNVKSSEDVIQ